jgi:integrase/recombinase XerD
LQNEFYDLMRKFLNYERAVTGKSEHTIISYETDLKQFFEYLAGNEEITDFKEVTQITLRSFMAFLNRNERGKRSINRKLSAVRSFFAYLVMEEIMESNPGILVSAPKYEKPLPTVLTDREVKQIAESVDTSDILGIRDRAMIELLYSSGIRASEILSLSEYNFNFEAREVRVTGKGEKERVTFFSKRASEWVRKYIEEKKYQYKNYTRDVVFVNSNGKRLTDRSLRRLVTDYGVKSEVKKHISPHTFRHSFATELLNRGIDIKYLQELLGHSSIMTTQVYTHVSKEFLREIYLKTHPFADGEK